MAVGHAMGLNIKRRVVQIVDADDLKISLGDHFKHLREEEGVTQQQVATGCGITQQTYAQ